MELSIVAWSESLRDQVLDVFGPARHWTIQQGRAMWRPPSDGEQWSRAIVLLDGQTPVAVAGAFHPRLHASREWAHVEVAPTRLGRGLGSRALTELRRVLPATARPLRAKVEADSSGARFAARHGLREIQRFRLVKVSVPSALSAPDLSIATEVDDSAVRAWRDLYIAGHEWDPPGDVPFAVWRELTPPGPVVRVTRDHVVGIAFVMPDGDGARFVGGAIDRDDPHAVAIAEQLLTGAARVVPGDLLVELDDWMWEIDEAVSPLHHEVLDRSWVVAEAIGDPCRPGGLAGISVC